MPNPPPEAEATAEEDGEEEDDADKRLTRRESYMTDLVLIDGSSYLYRAFHALPALTNHRANRPVRCTAC